MSNSALGESLIKKHWSLGLLTHMNNPEAKLKEDDQIVVIKDKYPKARHHILILPKKNIADLTAVTRDDLKILYHMDAVAREFVSLHNEYEFKVGYHAVPSMKQLHLHVISTDFDSPCLKTKIHWNSFNTAFFISSTDICKQFKECGRININLSKSKEYLKMDLKCHKCSYVPKTMPDLKKHLLQHCTS